MSGVPTLAPEARPQAADLDMAQRLRLALSRDTPLLRELVRRGARTSATCMVGIGAVPTLVRVNAGVPATHSEIPLMSPWDFAVRGSAPAWAALWRPYPEPGWHDLFALTKRGEFTIEGNLLPFMASLQYFKDLLAMPREATQ